MLHIDLFRNVFDGVLIGNVSDHESGSWVLADHRHIDVKGHAWRSGQGWLIVRIGILVGIVVLGTGKTVEALGVGFPKSQRERTLAPNLFTL